MSGGECWFCYHGWPKAVSDIYAAHTALAGYEAMHFGPAHIVWEDENFERESVQWCLDHFDEHAGDHAPEVLEAVRASLVALLALPDSTLNPRQDYDEEAHDVRDFPPPDGLEMARRVG